MRFLLSLAILIITFFASAPRAEARSVRVEVDTTGIFVISHAELSALGFENPSAVGVYGYGGILASGLSDDEIPATPGPTAYMHTADGRLLFYGEADVRATLQDGAQASFIRNSFDSKGVYFLRENGGEAAPEPYPHTGVTEQPVDYHYHIEMIERELQSPGEMGATFHSTVLKPGDCERYSFPIADFRALPTGATAVFRYDIAVNSQYVTRVTTKLSDNAAEILNTPLMSITNMLANRLYNTSTGNIVFAPRTEGAFRKAVVDFDICIASVFRGTYAAVDRAYIIYPRTNRLRGGELFMNFMASAEPSVLLLWGAESDVQVWNVTNPGAVRPYEVSYDEASETGAWTFGPTSASARLVAFNPSEVSRRPRICSRVESANLRDKAVPDYLIVTTETLKEAAGELARIHRELQGLDVAVVSQEDVYNEFSSGMRMPDAIRRLVATYLKRQPGKLRYVLLYGPTEWDVRHILGKNGDCLPSYMCEDPVLTRDLTTAYNTDIYFGMTDDDFSPGTIYKAQQRVSVGRLPLPDVATARVINEKSRRYLLSRPAPDAFLRVVKFSDDGDMRAHFDYSEEAAWRLTEGNEAITVSRADNLLYPWKNNLAAEASRKLREVLRRGAGLMYFTGHGSETGLTAQQIYNVHFIASEQYDHAPLTFLSSCVTFPYGGNELTMVPRMVFSPKGGAMGAVGACRPVYLEQNRPLGNTFAQAYAAAKPGDSGADILRAARALLLASGATSALGYNTLCYNFCGDPALPLYVPQYVVGFAAPDGNLNFRAHEQATLTGMIINTAGEEIKDFNGTALVQVFDLPVKMQTLTRNADDGASVEVLAEDVVMAEFGAEVVDGRFSIPVVFPEVSASGSRKVVVTAVDTVTGICAAGVRRDMMIDAAEGADSSEASRILSFAVDAGSKSGIYVNPSFRVVAKVSAGAAGLSPQTGLYKGVALLLDGRSLGDNALIRRNFGSDGIIDITADMAPVAKGPHELVLRVLGNTGMEAEASIDFVVGDSCGMTAMTADDADPARTAATLFAEVPGGASATLMIEDAGGKIVYRREGCSFPFRWELTDNDGKPVPDGLYRAWAVFEDDGPAGSTEKAEITVVKPASRNKN